MKHKEEQTHKDQSLGGCVVISCCIDDCDGDLELFAVAVQEAVEHEEEDESKSYANQDFDLAWMFAVLVQSEADSEDHADFHSYDGDFTHEFCLSGHQVNIPDVHSNHKNDSHRNLPGEMLEHLGLIKKTLRGLPNLIVDFVSGGAWKTH